MLRRPSLRGQVLYKGLAVLIPKVQKVLSAKDLRPIVLTEVLTKLVARLTTRE